MKNIYTRINAIEKDISNRINTIELGEHEVSLKTIPENVADMNKLIDKDVNIIKSGIAKMRDLLSTFNSITTNDSVYKELIKQKQELKNLGLVETAAMGFAIENYEIIEETKVNLKSAMQKAVKLIEDATEGIDI